MENLYRNDKNKMGFDERFLKAELLDKVNDETLAFSHKEQLGFEVPDDYFEKSKLEIQDIVSIKKEGLFHITSRNLKFILPIAAGIALLLTLTVFKPGSISTIKQLPEMVLDTINHNDNNEFNENNALAYDDISINSLFVSDDEIDNYLENYLLESLVKDDF